MTRSSSRELYELVFEGLSETTALQLAQDVQGRPMASPGPDEGVVDVRLPRLKLNARTVLVDVSVRILRYGNQYDVVVLFESDLEWAGPFGEIMDALHEYAMKLSQRHNVKSYYAGLDPAMDEDTRFFTGTSRGPH